MGLAMSKELPNGVELGYYRIVSLTTMVGVNCIIEVAGYTDQKKRAEEQSTGADVYVDTQFVNVDYDPEMSVAKAYSLLKGMPEFADARDVVDAWAVGAAYRVNDTVAYDGETYRCIQEHTAQGDWTPPVVPALWAVAKKAGAPRA